MSNAEILEFIYTHPPFILLIKEKIKIHIQQWLVLIDSA